MRRSKKRTIENGAFIKDGKIAVSIDGVADILETTREEVEQEICELNAAYPDSEPFPKAFYENGQAYWYMFDVMKWFLCCEGKDKSQEGVSALKECFHLAESILSEARTPASELE